MPTRPLIKAGLIAGGVVAIAIGLLAEMDNKPPQQKRVNAVVLGAIQSQIIRDSSAENTRSIPLEAIADSIRAVRHDLTAIGGHLEHEVKLTRSLVLFTLVAVPIIVSCGFLLIWKLFRDGRDRTRRYHSELLARLDSLQRSVLRTDAVKNASLPPSAPKTGELPTPELPPPPEVASSVQDPRSADHFVALYREACANRTPFEQKFAPFRMGIDGLEKWKDDRKAPLVLKRHENGFFRATEIVDESGRKRISVFPPPEGVTHKAIEDYGYEQLFDMQGKVTPGAARVLFRISKPAYLKQSARDNNAWEIAAKGMAILEEVG